MIRYGPWECWATRRNRGGSDSWYRPAAIAFTRVAEGLGNGKKLSDQEMNDLSKSINAYLSLTALELIGLNEEENGVFDPDWHRHRPTLAEATDVDPAALLGPRDGVASEDSIRQIEEWFRKIAAETGALTPS